jgi:hypothetical protein
MPGWFVAARERVAIVEAGIGNRRRLRLTILRVSSATAGPTEIRSAQARRNILLCTSRRAPKQDSYEWDGTGEA